MIVLDERITTSVEARLANLRAWRARVSSPAPWLDARIGALEGFADDRHAQRAAQPFRERFPALHKWAAEILAHQVRRTPLEVAAAYELLACQCEEVGQWGTAEAALAHAGQQFGSGGPSPR